jgi:hypothetical protein
MISKRSGDDIYATDAGSPDGILTCNMRTPDRKIEGMDGGLVARLVNRDNYWLVFIRHDMLGITYKEGGQYKHGVDQKYKFNPKTSYQLKVVVQGDNMTVLVNGTKQAELKIIAHGKATQFGLRDNSQEGSQPYWSEFKVVSP